MIADNNTNMPTNKLEKNKNKLKNSAYTPSYTSKLAATAQKRHISAEEKKRMRRREKGEKQMNPARRAACEVVHALGGIMPDPDPDVVPSLKGK